MWYLNPKNMMLMILAVAVVALGMTFAFQRASITSLKAERDKLEADYNIQTATIARLNQNVKDAQKLQGRLQTINDNTARIRASVVHSGGTNEEMLNAANRISDYFNNNGMLDKASSDSTDSKVLPGAGKADTPKSQ